MTEHITYAHMVCLSGGHQDLFWVICHQLGGNPRALQDITKDSRCSAVAWLLSWSCWTFVAGRADVRAEIIRLRAIAAHLAERG